jgi:photosystem II stability/assembly factor-like uncharacterized protein
MISHFRRASLGFVFCIVVGHPASGDDSRWTNLGLPGGSFGPVIADPAAANRFYVSTTGGVFQTDDGHTWRSIGEGLSSSEMPKLVVSRGSSPTLYAGTVQGRVFERTGDTWTEIALPFPASLAAWGDGPESLYFMRNGDLYRYELAARTWTRLAVPAPVSRVAALHGTLLIQTFSPPALSVSVDGGANWKTTSPSLDLFSPSWIEIDPANDRFLVASRTRVQQFSIAEQAWRDMGGRVAPCNCVITHIAADRSSVVMSTTAGVFTYDATEDRWKNSGVPALATAYVRPAAEGYYASGPTGLFFLGRDGKTLISFNDQFRIPYVYDVAIDGPTVYAMTDGGLYRVTDDVPPYQLSSMSGQIVVDDDHTLFLSNSNDIRWSADGGRSWRSVRQIPTSPVYAFTTANRPSHSLIIVTDDGMWVSEDGGDRWSSRGTPTGSYIYDGFYGSKLATDPNDGTIYVATSAQLFRVDNTTWNTMSIPGAYEIVVDTSGRLFSPVSDQIRMSEDHGGHWHTLAAVPGLISAVAIDPARPTVLYAGTADGHVYRSTNTGATWAGLGEELSGLLIRKLVVDSSSGQIYAGTSGGLFRYSLEGGHPARAVAHRVSLQTSSGNFVAAEDDDRLKANATSESIFALYDVNGGELRDGDVIHLRSSRGDFVAAEEGGASCAGCEGPLYANRVSAGAWESFVIRRRAGEGVIADGDEIALVSSNGSYVAAENGGWNACDCDSPLNANRTAAYAWETFKLSLH